MLKSACKEVIGMEQVLPIEMQELVDRWRIKKEAYRDQWGCAWPAKLVWTRFSYRGNQYYISPTMIGLEKGDCWDEGFMEFLQPKIEADLEALGATNIVHYGFLD